MQPDDPTLRAWYDAVPLDTERMRELLDPGVEFHVCDGWPNGGTYRGRDAVLLDFFPTASRSWESLKPEIDAVIEAGDEQIVRGRYVGLAAGTRAPFSAEYIHVWKVRHGRIVSLHQVADSAVLERARAA